MVDLKFVPLIQAKIFCLCLLNIQIFQVVWWDIFFPSFSTVLLIIIFFKAFLCTFFPYLVILQHYILPFFLSFPTSSIVIH